MFVGVNACRLEKPGIRNAAVIKSEPTWEDTSYQVLVGETAVEFLYLFPQTQYIVKFDDQVKTFRTAAWPASVYPLMNPALYLPETVSEWSPALVRDIIIYSPDEYFWTSTFSVKLWEFLFQNGLFALPHDFSVLVPNPKEKFCIDLSASSVLNPKRFRGIETTEFRVDIISRNSSAILVEMLNLCAEWHTKLGKSKSTWINSEFISNIKDMLELCPRIEFVVFRLVEKASGSTASCSIGYRAGNAFMDFTACTPLRDKRSCGKALLMYEAEYLRSRGIQLWYLGFKLPYMDNMPGKQVYNRGDFQTAWDKAFHNS